MDHADQNLASAEDVTDGVGRPVRNFLHVIPFPIPAAR
jgi:hypothetical protein